MLAHLSQTHLIGENPIYTLFIQISEPCQAFELIFFQLSHEHLGLSDRDRISTERRVLEIQLVTVDWEILALWSRKNFRRIQLLTIDRRCVFFLLGSGNGFVECPCFVFGSLYCRLSASGGMSTEILLII